MQAESDGDDKWSGDDENDGIGFGLIGEMDHLSIDYQIPTVAAYSDDDAGRDEAEHANEEIDVLGDGGGENSGLGAENSEGEPEVEIQTSDSEVEHDSGMYATN